jgi:acyl carrier protein
MSARIDHMDISKEREKILREIISLHAIEFPDEPEKLDLDMDLTKDLKLDELDCVEVMMDIEKEFVLPTEEIPEKIALSFKTGKEILNYLEAVDARPREL